MQSMMNVVQALPESVANAVRETTPQPAEKETANSDTVASGAGTGESKKSFANRWFA